jgi:hypothetical protein
VSKLTLSSDAKTPPTPDVLRILLDAWGVVLEGGPVTAMAFAPVGESFPTVFALGHSGRQLNAAKIKAKVETNFYRDRLNIKFIFSLSQIKHPLVELDAKGSLRQLQNIPRERIPTLLIDNSLRTITCHCALDIMAGDFTLARAGESCATDGCTGTLAATHGIEVGHAFYLGEKYSLPFGAKFADEHGISKCGTDQCWYFCVGINLALIFASAELPRWAAMGWACRVLYKLLLKRITMSASNFSAERRG